MHKLSTLVASLALAAPLAAGAQTPPPAAPEEKPAASAAPAAPAPKWYEAIEVHGLADGYYQLRLDADQTNPAALRSFDDLNGFNLGYAKVSVGLNPSPAGFKIDLGYGRAADKITPEFNADGSVNTLNGLAGVRYVQQAYAAVKLGIVQLDVGRFVTSAGAEVIEAKDNWLYSRSLLFTNIPLTHVGARATVAVPGVEGLSAIVGVNNGWDVSDPNSPHKTAQLAFTYSKAVTTLAGTLLVGKQPGIDDTRTLVDLVAQQGFGPLAVNVNFDYYKQGSATAGVSGLGKWWGVAAMAKYSLPSDVARISVRGEYLKDEDGLITGVASNKLFELTGGVAVPYGSNGELRAEIRYDKSDEKLAIFRSVPEDKQVTGTIAALAWF